MNGNNPVFQIFFQCALDTREEAYAFISRLASREERGQKEVNRQLKEREKAGSLFISEHVILPHVESQWIQTSRIIFIRPKRPIVSWNGSNQHVYLLVCVLLEENESVQIKRKIASFIRALADEKLVNRLINVDEKEKFIQKIPKIQEGLE